MFLRGEAANYEQNVFCYISANKLYSSTKIYIQIETNTTKTNVSLRFFFKFHYPRHFAIFIKYPWKDVGTSVVKLFGYFWHDFLSVPTFLYFLGILRYELLQMHKKVCSIDLTGGQMMIYEIFAEKRCSIFACFLLY